MNHPIPAGVAAQVPAETAGFVFNNPNAKGMCGCGESFTV